MMKLLCFLVLAIFLQEIIAAPSYVTKLTREQEARLASWKESDKQSIWEISGQFEGDMILTPGQRNGLLATRYRWPNNEIPYEIAPGYFSEEQEAWIHESLLEFAASTCVRTRLRTTADSDYVRITGENSGCWSYVGRRGGRQDLNLQSYNPGEGCLRNGTIVHEFLHSFGFYHQQSSTERDEYVDIIWENIQAGTENNFEKHGADTITNFGQIYDYDSVMHYGAYAFSVNNEATIVPKDPAAEIGQRLAMSEVDIAKLNLMYGCA